MEVIYGTNASGAARYGFLLDRGAKDLPYLRNSILRRAEEGNERLMKMLKDPAVLIAAYTASPAGSVLG